MKWTSWWTDITAILHKQTKKRTANEDENKDQDEEAKDAKGKRKRR